MSAAYDVDADQIVPRKRVWARTINWKRIGVRELARGRLEREAIEKELGPVNRPVTRADCVGGPRPCPWVSCSANLYLEMSESCALDVADRGGATLEEVGALINMTRERVRQIELQTAERMREGPAKEMLRALAGERE